MKPLDKIANIGIIIAVAVFLALVIRRELPRRTAAPPQPPSALVGTTISLPGLRFPVQQYSLVFGVSTSCHFCSDSLPFYKQLADQLRGRLGLIAVFPQPQAQAEKYLEKAGISGVQAVSANLGTIGVYATPTLLLVDSTGKVKSAWVGKQDEAGQLKVLTVALQQMAPSVPRN